MKKYLNKKIIGLIAINLLLLSLNVLPVLVFAVDNTGSGYQLLEPSIIIDNDEAGTGELQPANYGLKKYLKTAYLILFVLTISVVVFWFILGGLEYMLSDIPNAKLGGRAKLKNALFGLAIALSSYLLLKLINPELLEFKLTLNPL